MVQKIKNIVHLVEAVIANVVYGFPSKRIKVIGVTGTDGKTTTTHLIYHILKHAGKRVSMISTIYAVIGGQTYDTGLHTTTPRALSIQKYLKNAVKNGDEYFVLESTSHALDQNRVWGVRYELGVVTNITNEHLDYHKNYESYVAAKTKLLMQSKIKIANRQDRSFPFIKKLLKGIKLYTYGLKEGDFTWPQEIKLKLPGNYNKQNILAAWATCELLGIEPSQIQKALSTFSLPLGRMDIVYKKDFTVIVDFAHTTHSVAVALATVRKDIKVVGRLIHVFGSAGLRDEAKRAGMGKNSGKNADVVIITEEDYRTEDIEKICREIAIGLESEGFRQIEVGELDKTREKKVYAIITDRKKAIATAISIARAGDVVITTGKAHEKSLARGKKEYPWDEYVAVKQALQIKNPGS